MSIAQKFYFAAAVFICAVAIIGAFASLIGGVIPAWETGKDGEGREPAFFFCKSIVVALVSAGMAANLWSAP